MQEGSKARKVATGIHDFEKLITNKYFYVDKTKFIKEWWENGDEVTLINLSLIHISEPTRPY